MSSTSNNNVEDKKSRFSIFKRKNTTSTRDGTTTRKTAKDSSATPSPLTGVAAREMNRARRSVHQPISLDTKLKQCSDAFHHYKDSKSVMEEFVARNNEASEMEEKMSKHLMSGMNTLGAPDSRTHALRTSSLHFGQTLHNLSVMRSKMGDRIRNDFCARMTEFENDNNIQEAKANNIVHEEVEYQLAKRNNEYYASLLTLTEIYSTYFETALTTMRNLQIKLQDLPKANQVPKSLRENFETKNVTKVFGVHLDVILQRWDEPGPVPMALEDMITYLERNCIKNEGLMRVPGHSKEQEGIRDLINSGKKVDYARMEITNKPHTVCGMVKMFTRELPDPLIPYDLFNDFLQAVKLDNEAAMIEKFKDLMKEIPTSSRSCLARIVQFFRKVVDNEEYTKMGPSNLSISFGMNIMRMRPEEEDAIKLAQSTKFINKVLEVLIVHSKEFFPQVVLLNTMRGTINLQELGLTKWLQKEIAQADSVQQNGSGFDIVVEHSEDQFNQDSYEEVSHESLSSSAITPRDGAADGTLKQRTSDLSDVASPRTPLTPEDRSPIDCTVVEDHKSSDQKALDRQSKRMGLSVKDAVDIHLYLKQQSDLQVSNEIVSPQATPRSDDEDEDLQGWKKVLDTNYNAYYYINPVTQQPQWEHPFKKSSEANNTA